MQKTLWFSLKKKAERVIKQMTVLMWSNLNIKAMCRNTSPLCLIYLTEQFPNPVIDTDSEPLPALALILYTLVPQYILILFLGPL